MISNPYSNNSKKRSRSDAPQSAAAAAAPILAVASSAVARSFSSAHAHSSGAGTTTIHHHNSTTSATTTFSQAFEGIEDSGLYHDVVRLQKTHDDHNVSAEITADRAAQRALDRSSGLPLATTIITTTTDSNGAVPASADAAAAAAWTDRDHQVLLQQPHVLYVSVKQRGNGVLEYIRNVPWQFQSKMVPDYIFSPTSCALFLSIRYHLLHPEYMSRRIAALRTDFTLRVLLVLVDTAANTNNSAIDDNNNSMNVLLQLNKMAVRHNMTLILSWSEEEAARYLETFKALHGKDASSIQKAKTTDNAFFADAVTDVLTTCPSINKTDATSILTQFDSVRAAVAATPDELALIAGLGPVKVQRFYDAFHKPFSARAARNRKQQRHSQSVATTTDPSPSLPDSLTVSPTLATAAPVLVAGATPAIQQPEPKRDDDDDD